jgi:hypothetical protein
MNQLIAGCTLMHQLELSALKNHHKIVKCMIHMVMGIEITDSWNVTPCSFVQGHYFIQQISTVITIMPRMWAVR